MSRSRGMTFWMYLIFGYLGFLERKCQDYLKQSGVISDRWCLKLFIVSLFLPFCRSRALLASILSFALTSFLLRHLAAASFGWRQQLAFGKKERHARAFAVMARAAGPLPSYLEAFHVTFHRKLLLHTGTQCVPLGVEALPRPGFRVADMMPENSFVVKMKLDMHYLEAITCHKVTDKWKCGGLPPFDHLRDHLSFASSRLRPFSPRQPSVLPRPRRVPFRPPPSS